MTLRLVLVLMLFGCAPEPAQPLAACDDVQRQTIAAADRRDLHQYDQVKTLDAADLNPPEVVCEDGDAMAEPSPDSYYHAP